MKKKIERWCWLLATAFFGLSDLTCKKPEEKPDLSGLNEIVLNDVKSTNAGQLGFQINYDLKGPVERTGIAFSWDSLDLTRSAGEEIRAVPAGGTSYSAAVDLPAFPHSHRVYYKIFMQDASGYRRYSPVYRHRLASMVVRNPYIVHGPGMYNSHPANSFWDYDEGPYGWIDNSLSVMSALNDISPENYGASLNGVKLTLGTVIPGTKAEIRHRLIFDVPQEIPIGSAKLDFYYKGNLVSTEQVEVVAGGLLSQHTRSFPKELKGNYAVHGDQLFNYAATSLTEQYFYRWLPASDQWIKLPDPPLVSVTSYGNGMQVVDGKVYLTPVGTYNSFNSSYKETLLSYDIASEQWSQAIVFNAANWYRRRALEAQDSFVYQGKVYWIVSGISASGSATDLILTYDPATAEYGEFMELPYDYFQPYTYRGAVLDGKVYLLRSGTRSSYGSTYTVANEFYELDMLTKKLLPKAWVSDKKDREWIRANAHAAGFLDPYLCAYKGKLYAYGGKFESAYLERHSTLFAVYDPGQNRWDPVSGYSFYTARVSQTDAFMLPMDDKLYLGHGVTGLSYNYRSSTYRDEKHANIYTLSVK